MKKVIRFSLKKKTMLVMVLTVSLISVISILLFAKATYDIIRSEYGTYCTDLANTVAHSVDISQVRAVKKQTLDIYESLDPSERIDCEHKDDPGYADYIHRYSDIEKSSEYKALRNTLRKLQDVSHVECLYLTFPDQETGQLIYLVDGAYSDIWHTGTLEPLYDTDFKKEGDINSGFGTLMDESDSGRIVTTAMPILSSYNQVIAYAGIDYSIELILRQQLKFVIIVILIMIILTAAAAYAAMTLVRKFIITPINTLSEASVDYYNDNGSGTADMHRFADLDIHTGDEIETLANSMVKMESDMNERMHEILSTKSELSSAKEYAERMEANAYKDPLTGVRNKRSYNAAVATLRSDIMMGVADFGIAVIDLNDLKVINDNYGHDRGDEAIIRMCGIICDVFKHSPVFRYGGDEFVVILQNHDLENIKELTYRFHIDLRVLGSGNDTKPWLKIDAAIGYAVFDPETDRDTDSVFERADKAMYADKMRLKNS